MLTPETWKEINELISTLISFCIAGAVPVLIALGRMVWKLARAWADAKIASIKNEEMRAALEFAMQRLDATAETVVDEIEQTILKRDEANKVIDPAGMAMKAIGRTKTRLPKKALDTFAANFSEDDFLRLIKGKVESKVAQKKMAGRPGPC